MLKKECGKKEREKDCVYERLRDKNTRERVCTQQSNTYIESVCVCMCVCVCVCGDGGEKRENKREKGRAREREKESERKTERDR